MTGAEFATAIAEIQTEIVGVVRSVVAPAGAGAKAKVFSRYAMERDEKRWAGLLAAPEDSERIHAWMIGFGGLIGPNESSVIRSIEPVLLFTVDGYLAYKFGTDAANSEMEIRSEVARVTWAIAEKSDLNKRAFVKRHTQLTTRSRLSDMGGFVVHEIFGELRVLMQPQVTG